jgi:hypothetical protein
MVVEHEEKKGATTSSESKQAKTSPPSKTKAKSTAAGEDDMDADFVDIAAPATHAAAPATLVFDASKIPACTVDELKHAKAGLLLQYRGAKAEYKEASRVLTAVSDTAANATFLLAPVKAAKPRPAAGAGAGRAQRVARRGGFRGKRRGGR